MAEPLHLEEAVQRDFDRRIDPNHYTPDQVARAVLRVDLVFLIRSHMLWDVELPEEDFAKAIRMDYLSRKAAMTLPRPEARGRASRPNAPCPECPPHVLHLAGGCAGVGGETCACRHPGLRRFGTVDVLHDQPFIELLISEAATDVQDRFANYKDSLTDIAFMREAFVRETEKKEERLRSIAEELEAG